jgi:hypothetical protein
LGGLARSSSLPLLGLAAIVALLVTAGAAFAEELTREEYVARVEPICKQSSDRNSRILKGVKAQVKRGALAPAGRRFVRAASVIGQTARRIAEVPKPLADEAKLTTWIGYLKLEGTYLRKIGKALGAKNKFKAQRYAVRLNQDNNRANNTVLGFGFDHCKIESSRYL